MGSIKAAKPQDTETLIFGSGAGQYWWWGDMRTLIKEPDNWAREIEYLNDPDDEEYRKQVITHSDIMRAVWTIVDGSIPYASDKLMRECRKMLFNVEDADLGADAADAVLQVATMGRINY